MGAAVRAIAFGGVRLFVQQLHQVVAAEVGGHQNNGVAEVDFTAFAVAHKAAVEDLIEQVHHVAVRFLHFIQQHHAVRTLAHGFGENAALTVTDVARRRAFQLRNRVRLLVFRQVDGNQRFFAAVHHVRQRQRGFGFPDAARADQQEHALRAILGREAGFRRTQALRDGFSATSCPTTRLPISFSRVSSPVCSSFISEDSGTPVQSAITLATVRTSTSTESSGLLAATVQLLLQRVSLTLAGDILAAFQQLFGVSAPGRTGFQFVERTIRAFSSCSMALRRSPWL
jgi:hypothetical protein